VGKVCGKGLRRPTPAFRMAGGGDWAGPRIAINATLFDVRGHKGGLPWKVRRGCRSPASVHYVDTPLRCWHKYYTAGPCLRSSSQSTREEARREAAGGASTTAGLAELISLMPRAKLRRRAPPPSEPPAHAGKVGAGWDGARADRSFFNPVDRPFLARSRRCSRKDGDRERASQGQLDAGMMESVGPGGSGQQALSQVRLARIGHDRIREHVGREQGLARIGEASLRAGHEL